VSNTNSLAEQIQQAYPSVKVVKNLNTVTAQVLVYARKLADGDHQIFVGGNDADAKAQVSELLKSFGWLHIMDLGNITTARGTEVYLPLWFRMYGMVQDSLFNIKIVK
jgi:predicted dinucleotide-binding enzyme